jgi:DNA modification methylase
VEKGDELMVLAKKKAVEANVAAPFWESPRGWVRLYQGDVREALALLPARSVHCVVTSPPYWGLRDYGTGTWEGGDPACEHIESRSAGTRGGMDVIHFNRGESKLPEVRSDTNLFDKRYKVVCGKCGARRVDRQIGSEPSPDCGTHGQAQCGRCFVCTMVAVFREVRRVLRDDGTLWLNLGDSYAQSGRNPSPEPLEVLQERANRRGYDVGAWGKKTKDGQGIAGRAAYDSGLPSGNLVGVPWRVALALQADGWCLRQDIIWAKPSPMPESVRNRCTKAHEYVFLMTKSNRYFYDAEAIKEDSRFTKIWQGEQFKNGDKTIHHRGVPHKVFDGGSKNKRSVWSVASQGFPGAHFATFPPNLIRPMILAGTSERGCCASCGAPWRRVVEERVLRRDRPNDYVKRTGEEGTGNSCANTVAGVEVSTVGWEPTCECHGRFEKRVGEGLKVVSGLGGHEKKANYGNHAKGGSTLRAPVGYEKKEIIIVEYVSDLPLDEHPIAPCVVLDPFVGSGTVLEVAAEEGRRSIGIDLSADYLRKFAIRRAEEALKRLRDPGTGLWVIDGHARPVVESPSARGPGTVRRIV